MPTTTNIYNLSGNFFNSIIGVQQNAKVFVNVTIQRLEEQIEQQGGEDKEELREILAEVRKLLDGEESAPRGFLRRFSETMQKHGWFTGQIAGPVLRFLTEGAQHLG